MALSLFLLLSWCSLATAGVVNVEFKFTPFVGDPSKADQVETMPGTASVFINNVQVAEQEVSRKEVPVLFEEREIAPAVWVPAQSLGPALRKGKNRVRIEFQPSDSTAPYRAQLRWASVTDQVTKTEDAPNRIRETNQSGEGVDDRKALGRVIFEREFIADFASDLPWHHYPPVTALSDKDRQELASLVKERAMTFKPNFGGAYQILKNNRNIILADVKKLKCLDKAYAAGVRIIAQPPEKLDFVITGNPEVVVQGKMGELFKPLDPKLFDSITDDTVQMCAGMILSVLYPPRFVVVRSPSGTWEVAY
ncbi:MAG: hypothetical protein HXX11_21140 [Desulfuromonadales bacterium]|nr:hypothetical protein [Desulfuromonadales bacterium]